MKNHRAACVTPGIQAGARADADGDAGRAALVSLKSTPTGHDHSLEVFMASQYAGLISATSC